MDAPRHQTNISDETLHLKKDRLPSLQINQPTEEDDKYSLTEKDDSWMETQGDFQMLQ